MYLIATDNKKLSYAEKQRVSCNICSQVKMAIKGHARSSISE